MTPLRVLERCRRAGIKLVAERLELRVRGAGRKPFLPELRRWGQISLLEGHAPARAVLSVGYGDELRRA